MIFGKEPFFKGTLPVRVEFDSSEKAFVKDYLKRKGQNIEVADNTIESYFSEEIVAKFRNSKYFSHNSSANMKIRVVTSLEEVKFPVVSVIAAIGTLGIIPAITRTYGRIQFELFDSSNNKSIRTFKYSIQHRQFLGTSAIFLGSFLPLLSDRFDQSTNERNFAIMRVAFHQFENDLMLELDQDKTLLKKFTSDSNKIYALLPFKENSNSINSVKDQLHSELESQLVKSGLELVERKKLDALLEEIKFSNSGLTASNRITFGKLSNANRIILLEDLVIKDPKNSNQTEIYFTIRCVDVETGKIIWSKLSKYSSSVSKSIDWHIGLSAREMIYQLQTSGEL
ncbi:CsgG/HfaB family protein [Leptospira biflexa]|uniref:CsgG/HfaB family protein n=1 Tax=Leptospira biflexa TaxID=172 RepID=UPI0014383094|nr:CsgG/HfaB family protein [Leptospira biflexa]